MYKYLIESTTFSITKIFFLLYKSNVFEGKLPLIILNILLNMIQFVICDVVKTSDTAVDFLALHCLYDFS